MRLTPSRAARADRCLWWARPEVRPPYVARSSEAAEHGKAVGRLIEADLRGRVVTIDEGASDEARATFGRWRREWRARNPGAWEPEAVLAVDLRTLAVRLATGRRDLTEHEVPWLVDALDLAGARLRDWKTGAQRHTGSAEENIQIALYGWALAQLTGAASVEVGLVYLSADEPLREEVVTLDAFALAEVEARLRAWVEAIPTSEPRPGLHCRTPFPCDAASVCPAAKAAMEAIVPLDPKALRPDSPRPIEINRDNAAALVGAEQAARAMLDALRDALVEFVRAEGGVPAEGGKVLRRREVVRRFPVLTGREGAEAETALVSAGLEDAIRYRVEVSGGDVQAAIAALRASGVKVEIKPETSWAAIRKAGGAQGERNMKDALTAIGAVREAKHEEWDERAA